ncbi:MAG TPA: thioesterase family protein [Thermomicrobiales bacterium]|nr:thioesterase family protein [Thermomicrobiales bacterium]
MVEEMVLPFAGFATYVRVRQYEMDVLGHVNNAVYLHYLEQAAVEHADALSFTIERLRELGGLFIARRHEIDYLRPATAGDTLEVVTWVTAMRGARAVREYAIQPWRPPQHEGGLPDGRLVPAGFALSDQPVVRARTEWAWVDSATGRPRRMPAELQAPFLRAAPPLAALADTPVFPPGPGTP